MNLNSRRRIFSGLIVLVFILGCFGLWFIGQYEVPVLMYHQVGENANARMDTISPANFQKQISYLQARGYRVVSLEELVRMLQSHRELPRQTVVLTFDDGWENNFINAFPVLKQYQMPATFFVPAKSVGQPGYMTWKQLDSLRRAGMNIGAHGVTHAYLPSLEPAQQRLEIFESKKILETHLKTPVMLFSYPIGGFTDAIKILVQEAGYTGAVTTNRGQNRRAQDVYAIKRIKITDKDTGNLSYKLSGYYNVIRPYRKPH